MKKTSSFIPVIAVIVEGSHPVCRKELVAKAIHLSKANYKHVTVHENTLLSAEQIAFNISQQNPKPNILVCYGVHHGMALCYQKHVKACMNDSTPKQIFGVELKNHKNQTEIKNYHSLEKAFEYKV